MEKPDPEVGRNGEAAVCDAGAACGASCQGGQRVEDDRLEWRAAAAGRCSGTKRLAFPMGRASLAIIRSSCWPSAAVAASGLRARAAEREKTEFCLPLLLELLT